MTARQATARRPRASRLPRTAARILYQPELQQALARNVHIYVQHAEELRAQVLNILRAELKIELDAWGADYQWMARDGWGSDLLARVRDRIRSVFASTPIPTLQQSAAQIDLGVQRMLLRVGADVPSEPAPIDRNVYIRRNAELIRDLRGATVSAVAAVLEDPDLQGASVAQLTLALRDSLQVPVSKAEFWATDQTLKLHADLTEARSREAGIEGYTWMTSEDERVRDEHAELNGTQQTWANPPVAGRDGERGHPGEIYRCRCQAYPLV